MRSMTTSSADLQKKFEELNSLKRAVEDLAPSEDFGKRLNYLQQLRNGASALRSQVSEHSTKPSVADISSLLRFAVEGIDNLVKERNQARNRSGLSGSLANLSFQSPFSLSSANGDLQTEEVGQNRLLKEIQDVLAKNSADIIRELQVTKKELSDRLDLLENRTNVRFVAVEKKLSDVEGAFKQTTQKVEQQYGDLFDRFRTMGENHTQKIEELQRQQQTNAAVPHVVHVNLSGMLPMGTAQLEGTMNMARPVSTELSPAFTASAHSTPPQVTAAQPSTSSNPQFVVHVPKKEPSSLERLINTPVCSPATVVPETKGTKTVTWGAPAQKSQIPSMSTPKPEKPNETPVKIPADPIKASESAKGGLFSGFQGFGTAFQGATPEVAKSAAPSSSVFSGFGTSKSGQSDASSLFSIGTAGGASSFADLASSGTTGMFQNNPSGFPGSGSKLFAPVAIVQAAGNDEDEEGEGGSAEYEPNVSFKPLVNLPEVEVKTGEEEYETLFKERAKLHRFDRNTSEWKERGLGDIAIQRRVNPETRKINGRVLMRWEKTFKICANHAILPSMKLDRKEGEKTLWRWSAQDFADGELKPEYFAVRFKLPDRADAFKDAFERIQKEVACQEATGEIAKPVEKKQETVPDKQPSLSEMFKPKVGSWSCDACYTVNSADKSACVSCTTPKAGSAPAPEPSGPFKNLFQPSASAAAQPGFGFSFGAPPAAAVKADDKASSFANLFGSSATSAATPGGGFSFASAMTTPQKGSAPTGTGGFSFNPSGNFSFSLTSPQTTPKKPEEENDEDDTGDVEAERTDLYFEPIVKLPEKVDLSTGEENELELYSQRAKLYRYTNAEWKERGLGDLKMLKDKNSNKIRLLMRREKILKVCCNHHVREDMELRPMPGSKNAWIWDAMDFSEGTMERETLAVKFKHEAHAKEFKELFDRCKQIVAGKWKDEIKEFDRVLVNENEMMMPIVDGGQKAPVKMDTNVLPSIGLQTSTQVRDDVPAHEERVDVQKEIDLRRHCYGDKLYNQFGVIYNGRGKVDAVVHPHSGLLRLKTEDNLKDLIAADERPRDEFMMVLESVTEPIDISDHSNLPQSILRYLAVMRIRELGEDEIWRAPIFERNATVHKQPEKSRNWENLKAGQIRVGRDSEYDSPFYVEFVERNDNPYEEPNSLAIHSIASDAHLETDPQSNTAKWKASDEATGRSEKATFKATFSDRPSLLEFERVFQEGARFAAELGVLTTDVYNG
ncbi:uncharacterized protein LOC129581633 isoform X2 [Paramacrobiotus metropolitanus]|nr:uncharacterized protein LOC129581633 isoform X2 [Paramacrobiotus metropolitanus]